MFLIWVIWLIMVLLVISGIAVWLMMPQRLPKSTEQVQIKKTVKEIENENVFWVEYVPAEMHRLVIGFKASPKVQTELLVAGDVLLRELPTEIRQYLNRPISCDRTGWLSQSGNPEDITPERARAAVCMAEVSQAIWTVMFEWGYRVDKFSYQIALDKRAGVFSDDRQIRIIQHIIKQISDSTGVSLDMATEMWHKTIEIMCGGFVSIPGIRASKTRVFNKAVV